MTFKALLLEQADGRTTSRIADLEPADLPEGDVTVAVEWSTLNYKDGLAITGRGKIVRAFPFVPGIDFSGSVLTSSDPRWRPGDAVVLTGWGVGERHWGGLSQQARVKGDWLVKLPAGLSAKHAMSIGTAGFTAMLSVLELEAGGVRPGDGEVLVTGAAGGVGSVAVALLAKAGHKVVASTGRAELGDWLRSLGAADILPRAALLEPSRAPLDSARWAGVVDSVGGATLAGALRAVRNHGTVAVVGLAGGPELNTTVYPFILRGVRMIGIDSVYVPRERREAAWARLATDLSPAMLDSVTQVATLAEVPALAAAICDGQVRGRVVVDLSA